MEQELEVFQKLLNDFSKVHIPKTEKTFMGICQYPGSRFEEICSRILAFYFNPNEEHGFRDLWFQALCQCIRQERETYEFPSEIRLEEKTSENKRIDILIETANNVYAIENKIGATLYNPLDNYEGHLNTHYRQKQHIMIVLSARSLDGNERSKLNDWQYVSYSALFGYVKQSLGTFVSNYNQKYLIFMLDFMETISKKMNYLGDERLIRFFKEKKDLINELKKCYDEWNNVIQEHRKETLREMMVSFNKTVNYSNPNNEPYEGWLFSTEIEGNFGLAVGLEGYFDWKNEDPIGAFYLWITTWRHQDNLQDWENTWNEKSEKIKGKIIVEERVNKNNNEKKYLYLTPIKCKQGEEKEDYLQRLVGEIAYCYNNVKNILSE